MAKLVKVSGETDRDEFLLGDDTLIGRASDCEVTLQGSHASRQHARITRDENGYSIQDLGSANGTALNGQLVREALLCDGDLIEVGHCRLTFLIGDEPARGETAPAPVLETGITSVMAAVDLGMTLVGEELADPFAAAKLSTHMEVLQEVAEASCGALEIDGLVRLILKQLLRVYPQADHAHALLLGAGEAGADLRLSVARHSDAAGDVGVSQTLLGIALEQRKAVLAADVAGDQKLSQAMSVVGQSLHSMMCCPLVVVNRTLGAIQVDTLSAGVPFNEDDLHLLATIAGQAAVAAENARLHGEVVAQQRLAAVGEAVSSIAHCIKNVLNGLQGGWYILDLGLQKQEPERVRRGWEMVKRNTGFMSGLVKDMLAYCRRSGLRREPTDIGQLLNETVLMVQESAAQKGIKVSAAVKGQSPVVSLDPAGVKRAVLNLLTNAAEACPENTHVQASAAMEKGGTQIRITVQDNGPGIPPEVKERLFEAFFTTKGSSGTGLGLALVHKVTEEHGGHVEVESEPGQGATFHMFIPTRREEAATAVD